MYEAKQRRIPISRVNWKPNKHGENYSDYRKGLNKLFLTEDCHWNKKNNTIQQMFDGFSPVNYNGANGISLGPEARRERNIQGGVIGNSHVLRASLVGDSHVPNPSDNAIDNQAHHIVEANNSNAASSRTILTTAGIDIDSPINGVLLPSHETDDSGNATVHFGSHPAEYSNTIFSSLMGAIQTEMGIPDLQTLQTLQSNNQLNTNELQGVIENRLNDIRNVLLTQNVPLNLHSDPNYTENGPETIQNIFQHNGII